jgi:EpsD family peptidyl-prolyl cis-trans isomerase
MSALLLVACGDGASKASTQVVAKVNQEEITVHQVNHALSQMPGLTADVQKQAARQVLERIVDQELLVQKANEHKLDRDPRTVQAMETARRQILAQAYLDSLFGQRARPTAQEVEAFYGEHPELFAERRIYRLQELAFPAHPEVTAAKLEAEAKKAKNLNDIVAWLKAKNIPFNANAAVKPAEQLPMEVVQRLAKLEAGQIAVLPAPQGFLLVQLVAAERQPLEIKQATPFIEQYLLNQRRFELARSEIKQLRDSAKIEYVGDFAGDAPAAAEGVAPKPAASEPSAIEKGIAGLK